MNIAPPDAGHGILIAIVLGVRWLWDKYKGNTSLEARVRTLEEILLKKN